MYIQWRHPKGLRALAPLMFEISIILLAKTREKTLTATSMFVTVCCITFMSIANSKFKLVVMENCVTIACECNFPLSLIEHYLSRE